MANTLRFKRGLLAGLPSAAVGEPLFTTDTFDLYIGTASGTQKYQKFIASGTTSQLLRGDGSLLTMPIVLTSPSNGQVLKYNGTSWVNDSDAGITGSGTTNYLPKFTGGSTLGNSLVFDNGTNVGINTNLPATTFQIKVGTNINLGNRVGQIVTNAYQLNAYNDAATANIPLEFKASEFNWNLANTDAMRLNASGRLIVNSASDNGLRFQVTGDGYFSGSVGIGVSPSYKLEVYNSSVDAVALFNSANANGGHIRLAASGTVKSYIGSSAGFITSGGVDDLGLRAEGAIRFATNGAGTDMMLDSSGNLGLGVTPSAWRNIFNAFQVGYTGALYGLTVSYAAEQVNLASNYYQNSAGNELRIQAGFATRYQQASGEHRWATAATSTANSGITFTQAMTLDASGRLGIGSTATAPLSQLSIGGNGYSGRGLTAIGNDTTFAVTLQQSNASGLGLQIYTPNSSWGGIPLEIQTVSTTLLRLTSGGNLLLGTTSDVGYKLDVNGTGRFSSYVGSSLGSGGLFLSGDPSPDYAYLGYNYTNVSGVEAVGQDIRNSWRIRFGNGAVKTMSFGYRVGSAAASAFTEYATLDASGNLGIGTASPYANLDLGASGANNIILRNTGNAYHLGYIGNSAGRIDIGFSNSNGSLVTLPYLSVNSLGNVLIGTTTNAGYKLDVNGTMRVSGASTFNGTTTTSVTSGLVSIFDSTNVNGGYIVLRKSDVDNLYIGNRAAVSGDGGTGYDFYSTSGLDLRFFAGATKALTLATTGAATFSSSVTAGGNLLLTAGTASSVGAINLIRTGTSPVASRLTFGTDGTGYSFAIGKNQGGTITDLLTILDNGAATFSSTISSTGTNGFAIGNLTNTQRIQYGSDVATSFTLLTAANAYAGLYAGAVVLSGNLTVDTNTFVVDAANNRVGVKQSSPTSSLHVDGSNARSYVTKTANYTMTENDYTVLCDTTSGGFTITLPAASGCAGRIYCIKKTIGNSGVNNVTIDGNASETIDGSTTISLQCRSSVIIQSDGSNWWVLAEKNDASCI